MSKFIIVTRSVDGTFMAHKSEAALRGRSATEAWLFGDVDAETEESVRMCLKVRGRSPLHHMRAKTVMSPAEADRIVGSITFGPAGEPNANGDVMADQLFEKFQEDFREELKKLHGLKVTKDTRVKFSMTPPAKPDLYEITIGKGTGKQHVYYVDIEEHDMVLSILRNFEGRNLTDATKVEMDHALGEAGVNVNLTPAGDEVVIGAGVQTPGHYWSDDKSSCCLAPVVYMPEGVGTYRTQQGWERPLPDNPECRNCCKPLQQRKY